MHSSGAAVVGVQPAVSDLERFERAVRLDLRVMLEEVKGMRDRLVLMEALLPAAPEEASPEDFETHPEGLAALRIELQGLIKDHVGPLLEELLAIDDGRRPAK